MGCGSRRVVGHEYFGLLSPQGNVVRRVLVGGRVIGERGSFPLEFF